MIDIREVLDKQEKAAITREIMHALPKWFRPPEDIEKRLRCISSIPFLLHMIKAIP